MVTLPPAMEQTLEALLPMVTPTSPQWQCSPVDDVGPWTLTTAGQRIEVTRSADTVGLLVRVDEHLVLIARGTLSTLAGLEPWIQGALKAQVDGLGRWLWEQGKKTEPWAVDRDVVWERLQRGDRLTWGIRGRCFHEYFLKDGALTRYLFDEGYVETITVDEAALVEDLARDPRQFLGSAA